MEGRVQKYGQLSPGRAKVWTEKCLKYRYNDRNNQQQLSNKVPVVYYLCSNQQLHQPHFMEVTLSSPDGLHLRDVLERINALRGNGIAAKYSWSSKRIYNSGYVWQDLCEDDLILPAHGNEYVLKGSEFIQESNLGSGAILIHTKKSQSLPRIQSGSSPSSSCNIAIRTNLRADHLSAQDHYFTPQLNLSSSFANASTQTEIDEFTVIEDKQTSIKDAPSMETCSEKQVFKIKVTPRKSITLSPRSTSSDSFPSFRSNTLESLIRDDIRRLRAIKRSIAAGEARVQSTTGKLKPLNMIMQLISCGSIYVKGNGFVPPYDHSLLDPKLSSFTARGLDPSADNPYVTSFRHKDHSFSSSSFSYGERGIMRINNKGSNKARFESLRLPVKDEPVISLSRNRSSSASTHRMLSREILYGKEEGKMIKSDQSS